MKFKFFIFLLIISIVGVVVFDICFFLNKNTGSAAQKPYTAQVAQTYKVSEGDNDTLTISGNTVPQFEVNLADSKFKNIWGASSSERSSQVQTSVTNLKGDADLKIATSFDDTQKQLTVSPLSENKMKPGLYTLDVKVKTYTGEDITITQDFSWGVLAINTNKGIYQVGEKVKIGMGVLDDFGNNKCIASGDLLYSTAKIWLTIVSPSGKEQNLSSDDGTITGSPDCKVTSVTNQADFLAQTTAQEVGRYTIHMKVENINGDRSVDDYFNVQASPPPFDIERSSYPTRIYPKGYYIATITVNTNQDYSGDITDYVPSGFDIENISDSGSVENSGDYQTIRWKVAWDKGESHTLVYDIKFPPISPEFYLVGPLKIGQFSEGREWQIASDAISQIQKLHGSNGGGVRTESLTTASTTSGNLIILICSSTNVSNGTSFSTPASVGGHTWSRAFRVTTTNAPRLYLFYMGNNPGAITSVTCTFSTNAVVAAQFYEYSGLATAPIDKTATATTLTTSGNNCNSAGSKTQTTGTTATISNPVELLISTHVTVAATSTASHTAGFNEYFSFNDSGGTGTFVSADQVTASAAAYSDSAVFNAVGSGCSGGIATFQEPVTITQNGFRFFDNADNITPGSVLGAQNANLQLSDRAETFRLRVLLDIDGSTTVGASSGQWELDYSVLPSTGNCADGTYVAVGTVGEGTPIAFNDNPSVTNAANISATGNDPADGGYTTTVENYYDSDANSPAMTNAQASLTNNHAGEFDLSLIDNSSDTTFTTYCLRISQDTSAAPLDNYARYPTVSTIKNDVSIVGGTTIKGKTLIR